MRFYTQKDRTSEDAALSFGVLLSANLYEIGIGIVGK